MENALPDTYLTGQPLNADTFSELLPKVNKGVSPFTPLIPIGTNADPVQTTVGDENPSKRLDCLEYLLPPPIAKIIKIGSVPSLRPRQLWEGTVIERQNGSFIARVNDRTNPSNPDEVVIFEFDELSQEDKKLVEPGASFYWTIGTERSPAGTIRNVEMVSFRRLPRWSSSSVREAEQEAREIAQLFLSQ